VFATYAFFTATVGLSATAAVIATAVTYVAVTAVTSWAIQALSPKPDFGSLASQGSQGLLVNDKSPVSPHQFVYGQMRKGGTITYYETTGTNNKFLHQVIAMAGHEVEEIGDIYINDEVVSVDGNGFVGGKWNNKIRINKHLGDLNSSFVGNGIAYLYVRFAYDQDVFANGLPMITAVVKGKKVYDPRTDTTAWSDNAALCVRDYIQSAYGMEDNDIDDVAFQAAANVCDQAVPLSGGGTEARYLMNGVVSAEESHSTILGRMMTACAGTLFWGAGKWKLVAADYVAPTKILTMDDLRSGISLDTRTNLRDQFNAVQGTFTDAASRWITTDYPPITSTVFETEDGGEQTSLDLALPMTTSAAAAQRIAKLTLFRGREQMAFTADFGLNALDVEVGEIIALSFERYGWNQKEFEVIGWQFGPNQGAGDLRVTLSLRETSEAAFDWNAEEGAIIANNSNLLAYDDVPTLGIPADQIVPSLRIVREKLTEVITINITTGRPEAVDRVEVQFAKSGTSDWKSLGSGGLGTYEAVDLEPDSYKFRARAINSFGYFGGYTETGSIQTAGSAAPPQDVVGMFYEVRTWTCRSTAFVTRLSKRAQRGPTQRLRWTRFRAQVHRLHCRHAPALISSAHTTRQASPLSTTPRLS
jgi:hypothetical protein